MAKDSRSKSEKGSPGRGGRVSRRREILAAAEKLMLSRGLSGVTTRRISKAVGCSDSALYVHFKGRLELMLAMLEESLPEMLGPLDALRERVGQGSPQENLAAALRGVFAFHERATPLVAGLFADPALHAAYRRSLAKDHKGPHLSMKVIEDYINAERKLERVNKQVNAKLAAYVLMASSFFRAFSEQFFGRAMQPSWSRLSRDLIAAVVPSPVSK